MVRLPLYCLLIGLAAPQPSSANCWQLAGKRYGIEPELLQAIAMAESGLHPAARNHNRDGSYDIGLMQINSRHLPALRQFSITEQSLLGNPCVSVMTGAWLLAGFIQHYGYRWEAVGAYNAGNGSARASLRQRYIRRVHPYYTRLKVASREPE